MKNFKTLSTRTKFIGLLAIMFVFVVVIITYLTVRLNNTIENKNTENQISQNTLLAESTGLSIEKEIAATFEKIEILAENPGIQSRNEALCNDTVNDLFNKFSAGILDTLSRMDETGLFYCSSNPASIGFDGTTLDYLQNLLNQEVKTRIISSATQNRLDPSIYFVAIHTPVLVDDEFAGSLGTALFLNELGDEFIPISDKDSQSFILIDDRGNQLYNSTSEEFITKNITESLVLNPEELNLVLFSDLTSFTTENNSFVAIKNIEITEDTSWKLLLVDEEVTSQGIDGGVITIIILLSLSVFALMYGMASLTNIFYLNPMRDLARVAEDIKKSTLKVDFTKFTKSTNPEVAQITALLHDAIDRIQTQQSELENTVEQRTSDLKKAKAELEASKKKLEYHVKDLEKINNIMVDREIRMKELKAELKKKSE